MNEPCVVCGFEEIVFADPSNTQDYSSESSLIPLREGGIADS